MIFSNIRTDLNFIFGQLSVARKLIRPTGLLLLITITWHPIFTKQNIYSVLIIGSIRG